MKRSGQKIAFLLLSLVVVSFLSTSFVFAADPPALPGTSGPETTTLFKKMFGSLFSGAEMSKETKLSITKWMLIFLVVLVVYSITIFLPFFPEDQPLIKWLFAIVIGILSFIFVDVKNIDLLLKNYEALGIAITSVIPLIIILTITYELKKKAAGIAAVANKVILILFFGYLLLQWAALEVPLNGNMPDLGWLYLVCAVVTLIWLLFEKRIQNAIKKGKQDAESEAADGTVSSAVSGIVHAKQLEEGLAAAQKKKKYSAGVN